MNRGGGWNNNARNCRSANRNRNTPENRNNNLGFRVSQARRKVEHIRRTGQQSDVPAVPGQTFNDRAQLPKGLPGMGP